MYNCSFGYTTQPIPSLIWGARVRIVSGMLSLHGDEGTVGTYDAIGINLCIDKRWVFIPWVNIMRLEYVQA